MASYSAAVEKWRPVVEAKVKAAGLPDFNVDKILYTISYESGGNPQALGDGGSSYGLLQSQSDRNSILTPEQQIDDGIKRIQSNGYKDWGENNTYNGQPFGALGAHPYPGGTGSGGGSTGGGKTMADPNGLPDGTEYIGTNTARWKDPATGEYVYFRNNPTGAFDASGTYQPAGWIATGSLPQPNKETQPKGPQGAVTDKQLRESGATFPTPGVAVVGSSEYHQNADGTYDYSGPTKATQTGSNPAAVTALAQGKPTGRIEPATDRGSALPGQVAPRPTGNAGYGVPSTQPGGGYMTPDQATTGGNLLGQVPNYVLPKSWQSEYGRVDLPVTAGGIVNYGGAPSGLTPLSATMGTRSPSFVGQVGNKNIGFGMDPQLILQAAGYRSTGDPIKDTQQALAVMGERQKVMDDPRTQDLGKFLHMSPEEATQYRMQHGFDLPPNLKLDGGRGSKVTNRHGQPSSDTSWTNGTPDYAPPVDEYGNLLFAGGGQVRGMGYPIQVTDMGSGQNITGSLSSGAGYTPGLPSHSQGELGGRSLYTQTPTYDQQSGQQTSRPGDMYDIGNAVYHQLQTDPSGLTIAPKTWQYIEPFGSGGIRGAWPGQSRVAGRIGEQSNSGFRDPTAQFAERSGGSMDQLIQLLTQLLGRQPVSGPTGPTGPTGMAQGGIVTTNPTQISVGGQPVAVASEYGQPERVSMPDPNTAVVTPMAQDQMERAKLQRFASLILGGAKLQKKTPYGVAA